MALTLYAPMFRPYPLTWIAKPGRSQLAGKLDEPLSGAVGAGGGPGSCWYNEGEVIVLAEEDGAGSGRAQVSSEPVLARAEPMGDVWWYDPG